MQHCPARAAQRLAAAVLALCLVLALAVPHAHAAALQETHGIRMLDFSTSQILSIGNQTSGKCSWYALRYARTILDGKVSSGSGMWSNGAVWSAGGYYGYSGSLSECLQKLYTELSAGKPVIVHLKNTAVSGVKRHTNRTSSYEYHLTGSGWNEVNYPHIATSAAYGHWVCVVGIRADADPANLKESDFYALDPARVSANGTLAVTRLLDGTIWTDNSPLKTAGWINLERAKKLTLSRQLFCLYEPSQSRFARQLSRRASFISGDHSRSSSREAVLAKKCQKAPPSGELAKPTGFD